jgi:hypothetical protein
MPEARKYQFMEQNLQRRVIGLKDKLPDIQKTLDTVQFLKARKVRMAPLPRLSLPLRNTRSNLLTIALYDESRTSQIL